MKILADIALEYFCAEDQDTLIEQSVIAIKTISLLSLSSVSCTNTHMYTRTYTHKKASSIYAKYAYCHPANPLGYLCATQALEFKFF